MAHPLPTDITDTCTNGGFWCFADWANTVTTGAFWIFALLAFCIVIFIVSSRLNSSRAFAFAGFTGLIGGVWLAILQLMDWYITSIFILVGAIAIAMQILSDRN